jgi:large subunit ribosomal protein L10
MESLRRTLPPTAKLIVCKNTLVRRAAAEAGNWEALGPATTLENAWVFAPEDAIAGSVKAYLDFEKALHKDLTKEEKEAKVKRTDLSGGVLEANFLGGAALRSLSDMPTKLELLTRVAVLIKKVPTKVALAINAVPTKVGRGVSALADGDEDKTKVVGDVFPKAA